MCVVTISQYTYSKFWIKSSTTFVSSTAARSFPKHPYALLATQKMDDICQEDFPASKKKLYSATSIHIHKNEICLPLKLERTLLYKTSVVEIASENGTALEL